MQLDDLDRPSPLADDAVVLDCGEHAGRIAEWLQGELLARGWIDRPVPLEQLHEAVPERQQRLDANYLNDLSRDFYRLGAPLLEAYRPLLAHVASQLGIDCYFQATPILRFHFPVRFPEALRTSDGGPLQLHSDTLGGHPWCMLNVWLALGGCRGSAALQLAALAPSLELWREFLASKHTARLAADARLRPFWSWLGDHPARLSHARAVCTPRQLEAGQALVFDARCLHGGSENRESLTRVSLDFRLLPCELYRQLEERAPAQLGRFRRGQLLAAKSVAELADGFGASAGRLPA